MKRVLFWQESFLPLIGGVEVLAPHLLAGLRERGYEFTVVTRDDNVDRPVETSWDGIPVHRCPLVTAFMAGNIENLTRTRSHIARLKRSFAPHLVHMNLFGPSALIHHDTVRAHSAPLLITLHATDNAMLLHSCSKEGLFGITLRSAQWVNCVSSAVLTYWRHRVPEICSYSSVLYNGFKPSDLAIEPAPTQPPSLLCLGRLSAEKGLDVAIAALASIAARFPAARLVIAGDGPERAALESQVKRLNLTRAIEFKGWVSPKRVTALIDAATAIVLPSRSEGLPSVAVEAALRARPVVATRVGGIPEIVVHDQTGLLVDADDASALAQTIAQLLDQPQQALALGRAARERAMKMFGFERYVSDYDILYKKLIADSRSDYR